MDVEKGQSDRLLVWLCAVLAVFWLGVSISERSPNPVVIDLTEALRGMFLVVAGAVVLLSFGKLIDHVDRHR